jgi:hypothetical protein
MNAIATTWSLCLNKPYLNGGYENSTRVFGDHGWDDPLMTAATVTDGKVVDRYLPLILFYCYVLFYYCPLYPSVKSQSAYFHVVFHLLFLGIVDRAQAGQPPTYVVSILNNKIEDQSPTSMYRDLILTTCLNRSTIHLVCIDIGRQKCDFLSLLWLIIQVPLYPLPIIRASFLYRYLCIRYVLFPYQ